MESAEIISPSSFFASATPSAVFPLAVGPESQLLQVEVGFGALHRLQVEAGLGLTEA